MKTAAVNRLRGVERDIVQAPVAGDTAPYYEPQGNEVAIFEAAYRKRLPVMLKGPTGCGKTRFVEYMAWRLKRPLVTVACHDDLTTADLVGRYLIVGNETVWVDGPLAAAVRVHSKDAPDLVLDPGNKTYYADGNLRALAAHCGRVVAHEELHEVSPIELARLQASGKGQPYARLNWLSHVLGSNGHPAQGVDVNAKFKMSRWPQIEREFPKHFRIATAMMKGPQLLTEIAEGSTVPLAEVTDFVNANLASGMAEMEQPAAPVDPNAAAAKGGLLGRLRGK